MKNEKTLIDYLTNEPKVITPEEPNRQEIMKILHEDYGYPKDLMREEYGVKRSPSDVRRTVPVDVAIFDSEDDIKNDNPKIFVETKKPNYNLGLDQLKDYMSDSRNVSFGIWYNGQNDNGQTIEYLHKTFVSGAPDFESIIDVPRYKFSDISEEIKYEDLKKTNNMKAIFKNLRGFLAANATGTTRDSSILEQLSMIIISKLYDERYAEQEYVQFRVIDNDPKKTSDNLKKIFSEAKSRWDDVFTPKDEITLEDPIVMKVVAQLQNYSLDNSSRSVISEAFESIISYATKGSQGQFFTPENVAKLMVQIASPEENKTVFDPASGTAGFLTNSMFHVWNNIDSKKLRDNAKYDLKQQYATNCLFGIEKDSFLAKISKAFMAVLGDGRAGIFIEDSLNEKNWKSSTTSKVKDKEFDIVLTNPPFGKDIKISDDIKSKFEFSSNVELAFVEEALKHLKDGGVLGVILPETIFHAPSKANIREKLFYRNNITHIIDLPHDTFKPYNNAKTDIIFIQKNIKQQEDICAIKINDIGHDHLGSAKYVLDENTYEFTDKIADDIPGVIQSLKTKSSNSHVKYVKSKEVIDNDLLVARPYFNVTTYNNLTSMNDLIDKDIITFFDGHGSPKGYLKGLGNNPYIRVKDIVNLEIAHNRLDDIPDEEYERLSSSDKSLKKKDIVFVRRGSYRIGDVGILYDKDLKDILTREILVIRVNDNKIGITPFNLLAILNSDFVRNQFENLVLMDTTLPNIGDRWRNIMFDIKDKKKLKDLDKQMYDMYELRNNYWKDYSKVFGING